MNARIENIVSMKDVWVVQSVIGGVTFYVTNFDTVCSLEYSALFLSKTVASMCAEKHKNAKVISLFEILQK